MADSPIQVVIRRKYGDKYLTTSEAAEVVGRSTVQLRRYRKQGFFEPSKVEKIGNINIPLYSKADLKRLKKFVDAQRTGPRTKKESTV